ncbi:hypothetical protein L195_g063165, partial [Trifolium pratense]
GLRSSAHTPTEVHSSETVDPHQTARHVFPQDHIKAV